MSFFPKNIIKSYRTNYKARDLAYTCQDRRKKPKCQCRGILFHIMLNKYTIIHLEYNSS